MVEHEALEKLSPGEIASAVFKIVEQDPGTSDETKKDIVPDIYSIFQQAIEKYQNSNVSERKQLLEKQRRSLCALVERLKQSKYGKDFERHPFFYAVAEASKAPRDSLITSSTIIAPAG